QILTTVYFYLTLVGCHLFVGFFLIPWFFFIDNREMLRRGLYICHTILRFIQKPILNIEFHNVPKNPKDFVFFVNHVTAWDCFWVDELNNENMTVIVAQFVVEIPLFGAWVRKMGGIPIKFAKPNDQQSTETNKESARLSAQESSAWLEKPNFTMGLFPEGLRTKTGKVGEFKPLIFRLAIRNKKVVYPCVLLGARKIHPLGQTWISPGNMVIKYGDAIPTDTMTECNEDIQGLMKKVQYFVWSDFMVPIFGLFDSFTEPRRTTAQSL
ncbi:hypothetical protein SARC_08101, partial [Sphaeroforma arctica JP610]